MTDLFLYLPIFLHFNTKVFFVFKKVQEKKKEQEAAKPDPDADYVDDDEDYGYDPEFENDDADSSVDEDDNEPVYRIGLMPGAAFGLPLHNFRFQKIKNFMFLKATSCIYY